jgi:hypothetical protein
MKAVPRPNSVVLVSALLALAASSVSCSSVSTCNRDEDTIDVYGSVNADRTVFSSIDPSRLELTDGGKLPVAEDGSVASFSYFPTNRIIKFHVQLAGYPTTISPYLSFSPDGDRTIAPCAGNQCLIRKRSKDEIVLRNDTCSEFWVWLTASTSATPFHQVTDGGVREGIAGASGADATDTAGASGAL